MRNGIRVLFLLCLLLCCGCRSVSCGTYPLSSIGVKVNVLTGDVDVSVGGRPKPVK